MLYAANLSHLLLPSLTLGCSSFGCNNADDCWKTCSQFHDLSNQRFPSRREISVGIVDTRKLGDQVNERNNSTIILSNVRHDNSVVRA